MKIEIKNRLNDQIILCGEYESIKDCLEKNRGANLQDANLRVAYLQGANLQDAYLGGANLQDANLRGANLQDAYLQGANLRGANLRDAYLQDAYLRGANGIELPIITISGSRHTFYYHAGEITIGCNTLTVEDWLDTEKAKSLGKIDESYTEAELAEYRQYVELVAKLMKK